VGVDATVGALESDPVLEFAFYPLISVNYDRHIAQNPVIDLYLSI
jgi:hypothetical protein